MKYLFIILGGALGSLLRFSCSNWVATLHAGSYFPLGTFYVNLVGSFVIGALAGFQHLTPFSLNARLFLFTGLLGGFTTYSAYALETFTLFKEGQGLLAIVYVLSTTILGLGFAAIGYWLIHLLKS